MAEIVLGLATSHSPMLAVPPELWETYSRGDRGVPELVFPPDGITMSFEEGAAQASPEVRSKPRDLETFQRQHAACNAALDTLAKTLEAAAPDITVIVSDDQDEWFFDDNMPSIGLYWGDTVRLVPQQRPPVPGWPAEMAEAITRGYGDVEMDIPVPSDLGRYLIESLVDADFDIAHSQYARDEYSGRVARRYPSAQGEIDVVSTIAPRRQGLPHGYSFIVKRLFDNSPTPILPVMLNTCYPPNNVRPKRAYDFGEALGRAIAQWESDLKVAVVASGGLSHFVVDEELDRTALAALARKDADTLRSLPRNRLYSGTSEMLNWVAVGGALAATRLEMELLDYVPVYRTEAGTGGGWAFAKWQ